MRVAIYTLGCKVNQYETQAMEQILLSRGHTLTEFDREADVYVINTCSVTAVSDKKSRQMIRRARKNNPDAVVAACGCYVQTHPGEARELELDLLGGTGDRLAFIAELEELYRHRRHTELLDQAMRRRTFEILPAGGMTQRTRAMMKVEDGCVNFCSYCIIPYARGPVRSLPLEQARRQARQLKQEGYREIVLTGIEISSYGRDLPQPVELIDLIEAVAQEAPGLRLRLGSLEPRTITEEFCRRASRIPELCPHFHPALQSGCDDTLRRMNRKYDTALYLRALELLRTYFEDPAITTDMITGFPEESEEEFSRTLAFIRRCGFAAMHIFPYSIRPGTPAAQRPQVPVPLREERAARATAVAEEMHRAYLNRCVGKVFPVLFEQEKEGRYLGHAPNYMEVALQGADLHNQILPVRIVGSDGQRLLGERTE